MLKQVGPAQFPRLQGISFEPAVVLFAVIAAAVTTLLFALAPALHAARGRRRRSDTPGARGHAGPPAPPGPAGAGDRADLRVGRLAVGRRPARARLRPAGRDRCRLHGVRRDADAACAAFRAIRRGAKIDGFYGALLERLRRAAASRWSRWPPRRRCRAPTIRSSIARAGLPRRRAIAGSRRSGGSRGTYFGSLGIPIVAGRAFDDRVDRAGARDVVIVSRRMARDHFGREDVVGQRVVIDLGSRRPRT